MSLKLLDFVLNNKRIDCQYLKLNPPLVDFTVDGEET